MIPFDDHPREPRIDIHGPIATHDQRCAVLSGQHAVLDLSRGVFRPSWKAQELGWQLVCADTWWKRFLVKLCD